MTCPECFYDRWDGKSPHLYGGRESAKLTCYGPRRPTIPKRSLDDALDQARKGIQDRVERERKILAKEPTPEPEKEQVPDVISKREQKQQARTQRLLDQISKLETAPVQRASKLAAPQPETSPLARKKSRLQKSRSFERRSSRSLRNARRGTSERST